MGSFNIDYFIHAANILLLAAYSIRDILWLRVFAVASSLAALPYFLLQPNPLWAPFAWSLLFISINLFQSWRLFLERRPVKLTNEEEEVRRLAFRDLPARKVLQIISIGSWITPEPGVRLIEQGKPVESISLLIRGKVQVKKASEILGELGAGEIVGSALLLSGAAADVEAVTMDSTRALRWEARTLERYLSAHPDSRDAFQQHLSRDLAGKVQRLGKNLSEIPSSPAQTGR
jgi:hypothetical protein